MIDITIYLQYKYKSTTVRNTGQWKIYNKK